MGLDPENLLAERIALIRETTHEFCRLVGLQSCQFVSGVARQKIRQQIPFDRAERTERLEVPCASAIACRLDAADSRNTLIGNQHVTQFSAKTVFALYDIAIENDATAIARPDDDRNLGLSAVCPKDRIVPPKRSRICIIQIAHRLAELVLQAFTNIEARPLRMNKVRGTSGTELARRAGRARSIQADGHHVREMNTCSLGGNLETIRYLAEADFRSLLCKRWMLTQSVDEKLLVPVHQRIVDRSSAKIDSGYDCHVYSPVLLSACPAQRSRIENDQLRGQVDALSG